MLDFRKAFIVALILGTGAIGVGRHQDSAALMVGLPLLVMGAYLGIGARHIRSTGLTEQFADSVYYLGFLFTLVALMVSLMAFRTEQVEFQQLVANFALALVTTIFGLAARIVLVNFEPSAEGSDPEQDILDLQITKLTRSVTRINRELEAVGREMSEQHKRALEEDRARIEKVCRSMELLSENNARSLIAMADQTRVDTEKISAGLRASLENIRVPENLLADKLNRPLEQFALKLDEAAGLLDRFTMYHCRISDGLEKVTESFPEFDRRVQLSVDALAAFNQRLDQDQQARSDLVALSETMAGIVEGSGGLCRDLATQAENSRLIMESLKGMVEQINRFPGEIDATAAAIRESTQTLVKSTTVLSSHGTNLREKLDSLSTDVEQIRLRFAQVDDLAATLDDAIQGVNAAIRALNTDSGPASLFENSMQQQLDLASQHQRELQRILAGARDDLEGVTSHFLKAVEYVSERLRS